MRLKQRKFFLKFRVAIKRNYSKTVESSFFISDSGTRKAKYDRVGV